jgi:hypothetical protein
MPVPSTIADLSTTASSNSPAGTDAVTSTTGPDDYIRALGAIIKQESDAAGSRAITETIAATSKATPVDADLIPISDSAASGALKKLTCANWKATLKAYFDTLYLTHGQCRLEYSAGNLKLSPLDGNNIVINGVQESIPSAGVSIAATALTPSTLYYIYAYMSGATMTLEASATGHATDATTGVEIKSADATRTLVGMAYCVAGPAWSSDPLLVVSWFNRRNRSSGGVFSAVRSTASSTYVELNAEIRVPFISFADEAIHIYSTGSSYQSGAPGYSVSSIGIDGITPEDVYCSNYDPAGGSPASFSLSHTKHIAEGYHYATLIGLASSAGTANWTGSVSAGSRTTLKVISRG